MLFQEHQFDQYGFLLNKNYQKNNEKSNNQPNHYMIEYDPLLNKQKNQLLKWENILLKVKKYLLKIINFFFIVE